MTKIMEKLAERRSFIRLREPIGVVYAVARQDRLHNVTAKDISADGLRFQTVEKDVKEGDLLDLKLDIRDVASPIHAKGKVMWMKMLSLEDNTPIDVGVELLEIEEDNKNTFLKFLCDLIYNLPEEGKYAKKKKI